MCLCLCVLFKIEQESDLPQCPAQQRGVTVFLVQGVKKAVESREGVGISVREVDRVIVVLKRVPKVQSLEHTIVLPAVRRICC